MRHEKELLCFITGGKIIGKRDRGRPRTSYNKIMISDARQTNYKDLMRLTGKQIRVEKLWETAKPTLGLNSKEDEISSR